MDTNKIWDVWSWCTDAYLRHGRKLSLPASTDPMKTYQWRYATAIAKKFGEWGLTDDASKKFIDIAVKTSKDNGTLRKGLAVLHQTNMLKICYEKLVTEAKFNTQTVASLKHIKAWLANKSIGTNQLEILLDRCDQDGYCNITMWFQASKVSPLYLALSRTCGKALSALDAEERKLLPSQTDLYLLRSQFLNDQGNIIHARDIFEQDWRELCLPQL